MAKVTVITHARRKLDRSGTSGTIATDDAQGQTLRYQKCGEETKDKFSVKKPERWLLTPKRLRPWNGDQKKPVKERDKMNCPRTQP